MGGDQSSTWQPLRDLERSVWTQPVGIRDRGRVSLPPAIRDRLPWIVTGGTFLAILNGNGSVDIVDWKTRGSTAIAALRERYDAIPRHQRSEFALAAMDRYVRLTGEKGGRLTLPTVLRTHLDPSGLGFLRAVVRDDALQLWDDGVWKAGRTERVARLEQVGLI